MRMHSQELPVADFMWRPKGDLVKRQKQEYLRKRGNEAHNNKVLEEKKGILRPVRRSRDTKVAESYLPCLSCRGLYLKDELLRHRLFCKAVPPADNTTLNRRYARASAQVAMFGPTTISREFREVVLERMVDDKVHRVILQDNIILRFGQKLFDGGEGIRTSVQSTKNNMRECARLLIEVRKLSSSVRDFQALLCVENWDLLVRATTNVASINRGVVSSNSTPSLALRLGYHISKIADMIEADCLKEKREEAEKKIARFRRLKNLSWRDSVTDIARRKLEGKQTNKVSMLPLAEDLQIMTKYVKKNIEECLEEFEDGSADSLTWLKLSKFMLVRLVMFNRKRVGELSSFEISEFEKRTKGKIRADMAAGLTLTERHFANTMSRCETVGKKNRNIPMLMTEDMVKAIVLLIDTRDSIGGVPAENVFVFANRYAYATGHINGNDAFRIAAKDSGAVEHELIRSTKLRHHIATASQVMDLGHYELEQLATFMT
jgi:hypothetical protein